MTTPIDVSQLPADVRKAGPKAQQLYATALDFERVLLQQLTQELDPSQDGISAGSDSSGDSGDGSDDGSSDGTTSMYQQMLPAAFAQGLTDAGGVGLADSLYRSLSLQQGSS